MADLDEAINSIVELARASVEVQFVAADPGMPFAVIPNNCKLEDLSRLVYSSHNERPERKKGTITTLDSASFCEYYTLFHDENSRVFANEQLSTVLAVLDYHEAGVNGVNGPRWGEHRVLLQFRHSKEWETWISFDGKKTPQMEFAEFLEDNAPDIVSPDAATMLEVARDLSAKTDVDFGSAIRMANGSVQFKYSEQVKGSYGAGNLEIPDRFVIAVPVYVGSHRVQVTARLRYRIASGKLTFWYDLLRSEAVEREAFLAERNLIADGLAVTIINGMPAYY